MPSRCAQMRQAGLLEERQLAGLSLRGFAQRLCEATRAKGEEYFEESADNLTGVIFDLGAYLL